jgi:glycine cleavage system regulatory protein
MGRTLRRTVSRHLKSRAIIPAADRPHFSRQDTMTKALHVATITGQDRPGILDDVCTVVERNSGQVLDLRATDIGGHFAMLALFACAETAHPAIVFQLREMTSVSSLQLVVEPASPCCGSGMSIYRLTACGADHVGVLRKLSHLLRVLSINVEQIDTRTESETKTTITILLRVPRGCPLTKLREFVSQLLTAHHMEWDLKPV